MAKNEVTRRHLKKKKIKTRSNQESKLLKSELQKVALQANNPPPPPNVHEMYMNVCGKGGVGGIKLA